MPDSAIRVVKSDTNDTIYYGNAGSGDRHGDTRPIITLWPIEAGGDSVIRVVKSGETNTYRYDVGTLAYEDTVSRASPIDNYPAVQNVVTTNNGTFTYRPVGVYISNGQPINVWFYMDGQVKSTGITPAIAAGTVYKGSADLPQTSNNLAYDAGVPADLYVGGASLSRDQKTLFLFTSSSSISSNASVISDWYKIVDSVVVDSGTVTPNLGTYQIGYGNSSHIHFGANSFENNCRWMWFVYGAGSDNASGGVSCYFIDNDGNFAFITIGEYEGHTLLRGTESARFYRPSIMALQSGYAGAVATDVVAVFSRLALESPAQPAIWVMT